MITNTKVASIKMLGLNSLMSDANAHSIDAHALFPAADSDAGLALIQTKISNAANKITNSQWPLIQYAKYP